MLLMDWGWKGREEVCFPKGSIFFPSGALCGFIFMTLDWGLVAETEMMDLNIFEGFG